MKNLNKKIITILIASVILFGVFSACGDITGEECAHVWDSGTVTTAATPTTDGVMTYTCTKCGEKKTETIPATGAVSVVGTVKVKNNSVQSIYIDITATGNVNDIKASQNNVAAGAEHTFNNIPANISLRVGVVHQGSDYFSAPFTLADGETLNYIFTGTAVVIDTLLNDETGTIIVMNQSLFEQIIFVAVTAEDYDFIDEDKIYAYEENVAASGQVVFENIPANVSIIVFTINIFEDLCSTNPFFLAKDQTISFINNGFGIFNETIIHENKGTVTVKNEMSQIVYVQVSDANNDFNIYAYGFLDSNDQIDLITVPAEKQVKILLIDTSFNIFGSEPFTLTNNQTVKYKFTGSEVVIDTSGGSTGTVIVKNRSLFTNDTVYIDISDENYDAYDYEYNVVIGQDAVFYNIPAGVLFQIWVQYSDYDFLCTNYFTLTGGQTKSFIYNGYGILDETSSITGDEGIIIFVNASAYTNDYVYVQVEDEFYYYHLYGYCADLPPAHYAIFYNIPAEIPIDLWMIDGYDYEYYFSDYNVIGSWQLNKNGILTIEFDGDRLYYFDGDYYGFLSQQGRSILPSMQLLSNKKEIKVKENPVPGTIEEIRADKRN